MWLQVASGAGLALCLAGEALRKAAILTARGNFTHLVRPLQLFV